MKRESSDPRAGGDRGLERAIVLVLLGEDDEDRSWSRAELGEQLDVEQDDLARALAGLLESGVLEQERGRLCPSSAARRLDRLELIAI